MTNDIVYILRLSENNVKRKVASIAPPPEHTRMRKQSLVLVIQSIAIGHVLVFYGEDYGISPDPETDF